MRSIYLYVLAASLALHGLIAGSVAVSSWRSVPASLSRIENAPTLSLIYPKPQPVKPTSAPTALKPTLVAAASVPTVPVPSHMEATPVAKAELPALAKAEANPNAKLPPPSPDAVLAPVPAPRLDGSKGVVFVLDVSGSMYEPYGGATRLAFARQEMNQRVRALPDGTPFAVVLYAKTACASGPLVEANAATREAAVRFIMRDVNCNGGTNLPAGLMAARALNTGALVLATDGDLNIACTDLMLQAQKILGENGTCPSMLILGIAPRTNTTAEHVLQDLAGLEGGTYTFEEPEQTALR